MTHRLPCRRCGKDKPMSEVLTRFEAFGKQGTRVRFRMCRECKKIAVKPKKEVPTT